MDSGGSQTRRYRGRSTEERRAERRQLLIEAAIRVYGQQGYHKATVKAVCEAAGLTERYFYESFANSEQLLIASFQAVTFAVYEEMAAAARGVNATPAERVRIVLYTYYSALRRNPTSARVFLVEIRRVSQAVDEALEKALRSIRYGLAQVVTLPKGPPSDLLMDGVLGGVIQIAIRWIAQGYEPSIDEVTDTALQLVSVLWRNE